MEFSTQECWSGLPFPSSVNHILFRTLHHDLLILGGLSMAWLIASLSYASPFTRTRLWSMKGTSFNTQNFKLWNSLKPQTLIPLSFLYLLIFSLPSSWTPDLLNAHTQEFSSVLVFHLAFCPAWIPRTSEVTNDHQVAEEFQLSTKLDTK